MVKTTTQGQKMKKKKYHANFNDRIRMMYRAFALYHRRGWVWISGKTVFKNRWIKGELHE